MTAVRVLLLDPSPMALQTLAGGFESSPGFEIVGRATDNSKALQLLLQTKPAVICVGLGHSQGSGIDFVEEAMRAAPTPILVLVNYLENLTANSSQKLRDAGALEVAKKPTETKGVAMANVLSRVRVLSGVKMFGKRGLSEPRQNSTVEPEPRVVAIGASTGGPQAIARILSGLKADFPWPILCVQHMTKGFLETMIGWMNTQTALKVVVAEPGTRPTAGHVYFAPEDRHLEIRADRTLGLVDGPAVDGHRPSATVLFDSVARVHGRASIGVILTGMGGDGARGLLAMAAAGASTMAQAQKGSVVFGMAQKALELGATKQALSLDEITQRLRQFSEGRAR